MIPGARNRLVSCLLAAAASWCAAGPIGAFYSDETSRRELFPDYERVETDTLTLDSSLSARVGALMKAPLGEKQAVFERLSGPGRTAGYIFRARELGKVEFMDFAVALDGEGKVLRVLLTAYRESIGGEVKSHRFMKQFKGKDCGSRLQLNRDVDAITGATLSSRAITLGVRKAVCLWKLKYGKI